MTDLEKKCNEYREYKRLAEQAAVAKYFDLEGGRSEWFEGLKEMKK